MARALREGGKLLVAYAEFGKAIDEAKAIEASDPKYKQAGEAAVAERDELAKQIGFVHVTVTNATADTKVMVGGQELPRASWDQQTPVMPGNVDVAEQTPGKPPVTRSVTVAAGAREEVAIDANGEAPKPIEAPKPVETDHPSSLRPWAYVAGGVAAAGLITFTVAGLMANHTYSDLQDTCGSKPCPSSKADDVTKGKHLQTIANVGLGVAVVGAAVGVTLFVLSKPSKSTEVAVGPTSITLRGAF
jgi:hypothetical protein